MTLRVIEVLLKVHEAEVIVVVARLLNSMADVDSDMLYSPDLR